MDGLEDWLGGGDFSLDQAEVEKLVSPFQDREVFGFETAGQVDKIPRFGVHEVHWGN